MPDNPKPRSEAQREAARQNGAKSKGPRGPRPKRHILLVANEDSAALEALTAAYHARLQPTDEVEARLVAQLVAADWRVARLWQSETALINEAIARDTTPADPPARIARAIRTLADESTVLRYLKAHSAQLERAHARALRSLERLRSAFPQAAENEKFEKPGLKLLTISKQYETALPETRQKPGQNPANPEPTAHPEAA